MLFFSAIKFVGRNTSKRFHQKSFLFCCNKFHGRKSTCWQCQVLSKGIWLIGFSLPLPPPRTYYYHANKSSHCLTNSLSSYHPIKCLGLIQHLTGAEGIHALCHQVKGQYMELNCYEKLFCRKNFMTLMEKM